MSRLVFAFLFLSIIFGCSFAQERLNADQQGIRQMVTAQELALPVDPAPQIPMAQSQLNHVRPPEWQADWFPVNWEMEKIEKGIVTDTIFIHHTAWQTNAGWQMLSDEQKKRLYDARYASADKDPFVQGQPAHSGHYRFVDGKLVEVFYAYHWIVRENGKVERLLDDKYVGWHAGNWAENLRSLAIVFDGDYSKKPPPKKALKAAAKLIREYVKDYPTITRLKAHQDVRKTECPGEWYHAKDKHGVTGRDRLLKLAKVQLSE